MEVYVSQKRLAVSELYSTATQKSFAPCEDTMLRLISVGNTDCFSSLLKV
jgi:hypothetical protein